MQMREHRGLAKWVHRILAHRTLDQRVTSRLSDLRHTCEVHIVITNSCADERAATCEKHIKVKIKNRMKPLSTCKKE